MNVEDQLQLRMTEGRTVTGADSVAAGTKIARRPLASNVSRPAKAWSRVVLVALVMLLTVGAASVWTVIAREQLASSIRDEAGRDLDVARRAFEALRAQSQASLQSHCRVMVEDPRLKSTLATEGIDGATVADILKDLGALRRAGFLMVLSPEGRVFAESGAPELRGLDLSDSSIVKKAHAASEAVVGSWVLGGKVMDLAIMAVRFGDAVNGYLVVGQPVDDKLLGTVSEQTGVSVASALANKVVLASTKDPAINAVFASAAGGVVGAKRVVSADGGRHITTVIDLQETAQSHRLVLVASLDAASARFDRIGLLFFAPPLLVLIAVLFSMSGMRSRRTA